MYRDAGLDTSFVKRALAVSSDTMWYPSADELLSANAITGVVTGEGFALSGHEMPSFESRLAENRWIRTLRAEMPDEYEKVIAEFKAIPTSSSAAEAEKMGFEIMANFRRRYATNLANAADQNLTEYLQNYLALLKTVRENNGPGLCAEFAVKGGPVLLGTNPSAYADLLEKNTSLMIQTIASARRTPQPVDPTAESDWDAFVATFLEVGGTEEELQIVGAQDASSPSYCQAVVGFFQAVVDTPAPSGHRIRAEMAKGMAES